MRTLVLDPALLGLGEILERRRRLGLDRFDEVWDGVLHVSPDPSLPHSNLQAQFATIFSPVAKPVGLWPSITFNLGAGPQNYRIPDGGLHRDPSNDVYRQTAALVLEVISPNDESWEKLPFYAASGVDEVLIIDPFTHAVDWFELEDGAYVPLTRSGLVPLGPAELAEQLDWLPLDPPTAVD